MPKQAQLFIASGCTHCQAVMTIFLDLLKQGELAQLEISNLTAVPALAERYQIKSVPWFKLGVVQASGAHEPAEIRMLLNMSQQSDAQSQYYGYLFQNGKMQTVLENVVSKPETLTDMTQLLFGETSKFVERIGIGAVIESLEGELILEQIIPDLARLSSAADHKDRVDAAYYLGLTHSVLAQPILNTLLKDGHLEVKQEAIEALENIPTE